MPRKRKAEGSWKEEYGPTWQCLSALPAQRVELGLCLQHVVLFLESVCLLPLPPPAREATGGPSGRLGVGKLATSETAVRVVP